VVSGAVVLSGGGGPETIAVLGLTRDVPSGAQLTADDLEVVEIEAEVAADLVDAGELDSVIGQYAAHDLAADTLLRPTWLRPNPRPPVGREWVPLSVSAAAVPDGIVVGAAATVSVTPAPTCDDPQPAPELIDVTIVAVPDDLEAQRAAPDAAERSVTITVEVDTVDTQRLVSAAERAIVPRGKTLPTTTRPAPPASLDCSEPTAQADDPENPTTAPPPAPVVNLDAGEFLVTTTTA
jgi:hypothetical protein